MKRALNFLSIRLCYAILVLLASSGSSQGQFSTVFVKIAGNDDTREGFERPTSGNRLCLIRGKTYTIRFNGKTLNLVNFDRIEITDGDFNQTFKKADLHITTKDGYDNITIPELQIPSSSDREDFLIKLRYFVELSGPDVCYAKVIEKGVFNSAKFIGNVQPLRINNAVLLQPNVTYRLQLTGENLDHANPFGDVQSLRSSLVTGASVGFTFSDIVRTGTSLEMNVKHSRITDDAPVTAKTIRFTDKEADQNTPALCNYSFAVTMPVADVAGTVPTNLADWVAGYGKTLLPDLVPVSFTTPVLFFRPLPAGISLQASNGNVYLEISAGFLEVVQSATQTVTPVQIPGLGSAEELVINLPDMNYGVYNDGVSAFPAVEIGLRVRKYSQSSDNTGVIGSSAVITAGNFPGHNVSRLVLFTRPSVSIFRFPTQPGKFFLKRLSGSAVGGQEEFKFQLEIDPSGSVRESREDNNTAVVIN